MEQLNEIAEKLKLLGDKTRLTMLTLLKDREWCVCDFVDLFDMSQPAISQHLRKLKSQGIVNETRRGQWVYYSLNVDDKPYIKTVLDQMPETDTLLATLNKRTNTTCD
ncbi:MULTISPECIES: metalloregulator ArsR/SmtB family transcription factor [Paenibacillus]|uniref:ArsR family transcriptional regulator n=1 Tax=Paenibacillus lautus TaxID=1401 RepID=A0A385TUU4_PAELA|nr:MULTISPECIES: metalloregulator ArsR/SmtB family transcription factor [Paenibacillus]AWP25178.1 transcriptional regulator [Paenibacillus sp. Cedars]AYB48100.1 ArsR family transcriptional regulator [Paenibacillus lautus]MBX4152565.1 metalloregulator ArsR/SmtB family transcription factor [Paenibacillus lautus]VTR56592.1 regulatory protein ArsR [Actinobacillus pleuropneumoniae]